MVKDLENYVNLAKSLDELSARFLRETGYSLIETSIIELMEWIKEKTKIKGN